VIGGLINLIFLPLRLIFMVLHVATESLELVGHVARLGGGRRRLRLVGEPQADHPRRPLASPRLPYW